MAAFQPQAAPSPTLSVKDMSGSLSAYNVTMLGAPVDCRDRSIPVWQHYN